MHLLEQVLLCQPHPCMAEVLLAMAKKKMEAILIQNMQQKEQHSRVR